MGYTNKRFQGSARAASRAAAIASLFCTGAVHAQTNDENPYSGYTGYDTSYFLDYVSGGFTTTNTADVKVAVTVDTGTNPADNPTVDVDLDTGSRGFYLSSDQLGANFSTTGGTYGQEYLSSSGRLLVGLWTPATLSFGVTEDQSGTVTGSTTVTSTPDILDVTTLSSATNGTATYGTTVTSGSIELNNGAGYVTINNGSITLSGGQSVSYSTNSGLLDPMSNFGIGFDLGGSTNTGPITNNANQIYNPLLNLAPMTSGSMIAGYIVETNGIQLGLTASDTGYAYTKLNPTGLASTNSVPDWQTQTGQTVVNGVTNTAGNIVMDSGVSGGYISGSGLTRQTFTNLQVLLINSGGLVGYDIDEDDTNNFLNPAVGSDSTNPVDVVPGNTNGVYSQNGSPWGDSFFNTGRNVFDAFDMLYDADDGYIGLLTNAAGASDTNIFFNPVAGGFVSPVPEGRTTALLMLGFLLLVPPLAMFRSLKKKRMFGAGKV